VFQAKYATPCGCRTFPDSPVYIALVESRPSSRNLRGTLNPFVTATAYSLDVKRSAVEFMGKRDFFDPPWEDTDIVLVDAYILRIAERWIKSCETCTPDEANAAFDSVLDRITNRDPRVTEYILAEPARCPRCKSAVVEKTLLTLRRDVFGRT
jgi:hypothetical protein